MVLRSARQGTVAPALDDAVSGSSSVVSPQHPGTSAPMKLAEAMRLARMPFPDGAAVTRTFLACGFTPLHLQTFLLAHLRLVAPETNVTVDSGLYGDVVGNVDAAAGGGYEAVAVVVEWADLDPRLGLRAVGGWRIADVADALESARLRGADLVAAVRRMAPGRSVAVCLPTLPLAPVSHSPGWQGGDVELRLRTLVSDLAVLLADDVGVRVVSPSRLDAASPPGDRLDVRGEVHAGFPYRLPHAAVLADLLARLLASPTPKKGLITDLDDTLWRGLVGEVGPAGLSWDLDHGTHVHALYQQMLAALADTGVLLAVATRNDPMMVEPALKCADLLVPPDVFFPIEVHWGAKSDSVRRILQTWNVAADSVVFVDDSPMDVAEVAAAHPGIDGVVFPTNDEDAAFALLSWLRDQFGKDRVSVTDGLRLESLRQSVSLGRDAAASGGTTDEFLARLGAELVVARVRDTADTRPYDLVNKTNQFNLNGRRWSEAAWHGYVDTPNSIVLVAEYRDRYGPLGKIGVLGGRRDGRTFRLHTWVMSCRAFSRRIEHGCLAALFIDLRCDEVVFDYAATARNGPFRDFMTSLLGTEPFPGCRLTRGRFDEICPPLFHVRKDVADA